MRVRPAGVMDASVQRSSPPVNSPSVPCSSWVSISSHTVGAKSLPSPTTRVVNLPGITLTVREMIDAMGRVAGADAVARVAFKPDARIQAIVKTWPIRFRTERADAMGFKADSDFESIVRQHLETMKAGA